MNHIISSPLSRFGATLAYHGVYIPSLKYALPQCFFPEQQLYRAERQTIQPILAKCGYNRNTALELRYAPASYAGCGFVRWYTLQGEGQIQLFIKHWRTETMISTTLRITVGWGQWQSGLSRSILRETKTKLPHLECRWITSLRNFLNKIDATIIIDNSYTVQPEREFDQHIMDSVIRSKLFSDADIKIINYCRLYLHVTTISELFDATGHHILPHMFQCKRPAWFDPTRYITIQPKPSEYQIRTKWKRFCRQWCTSEGQIAASVTLGRWILPHHVHLRPRRETYSVHDRHQKQRIYHWIDTTYWLLSPVLDPEHCHLHRPDHSTTWLPDEHAIPIQISEIQTHDGAKHYHCPSYVTDVIRTVDPRRTIALHHDEFTDYVKTLPAWEQCLLQDIELDPGVHTLMEHIHDITSTTKRLIIAFTGNAIRNTASYGWIIGNNAGHKYAWKTGTISETTTNHRSTNYGHLSALRFLFHLPKITGRPYPDRLRLIAVTDYSQAITTAKRRRKYAIPYPNSTLTKDWDIVEEIHSAYAAMGIPDSPIQWIRSDQDTRRPPARPSPAARYIIEVKELVDLCGSTALNSLGSTDSRSSASKTKLPPLPTARCLLYIRNKPIYSNYTKHIREAASLPELHGYFRRRYKWTKDIIADVQWHWFQSAVRTYSHSDNHLMKLVYDQLPTTAQKNKTGGQPWLPCLCRHCNAEPETFDHLLRCDHDLGNTFRRDLVKSVTTLFNKWKIPTAFRTTLLDSLQDWFLGTPSLEFRMNSPAVNTLIHAQRKIGWTRFLRGFLSTQWQRYLEYEQNHEQKPQPTHFDYNNFFRQLIKTFWGHQSTFWKDYQAALHEKQQIQARSPIRESLQHEIRHLYTFRNAVAPTHGNEYFPANLKKFFETSSDAQLQNYILHYKQPILRSVAHEKLNPERTRKIWSFCGFTRRRRTRVTPHDPDSLHPAEQEPTTSPSAIPMPTHAVTPTSDPAPCFDSQHQLPKKKESIPYKHSRWKNIHAAQDRFRAYFSGTKPPKPH